MNRRKFIRNTSIASAGITILNFPVFGQNAPSNKVVVGVMGVNGRGGFLAESFARMPNVELGYICDVEEGAIAKGMKPFANADRKPTVIRDIRELVAKKDLDALVVAAPDHWHAPATLLGVAHGKHVYVEKPCSHNPYEGELLVKAMKKYPNTVIQMGSQRRSFPTLIEAVQMVREGIIGNAYHGRCWYNNNRKSIGFGKKIPVPSTLDFNLWQGPAPRRAYQDNLVHYNWHWFWHWGTSETCNNASHELDCCRWFMDVDYPTRVTSAGGRYAFKDDWQTPDTQTASFEFGKSKSITWDGHSCNNYPTEGSGRGFVIYGDKGVLINLGNDDYKIVDNDKKVIKEVKSVGGGNGSNTISATGNLDNLHFTSFIEAVRGERKVISNIEEGHKSVMLCHLANIAQRTGRTLYCDPSNGHILNDPGAMKLWKREYEKGWEPKV